MKFKHFITRLDKYIYAGDKIIFVAIQTQSNPVMALNWLINLKNNTQKIIINTFTHTNTCVAYTHAHSQTHPHSQTYLTPHTHRLTIPKIHSILRSFIPKYFHESLFNLNKCFSAYMNILKGYYAS